MKRKQANKNQNQPKRIISIAATVRNEGKEGEILSDVTGSYTGMTISGERPEQDVDDL